MKTYNRKASMKNRGKRNMQRLIYGRTIVIISLLLIQFLLFASMTVWLKEYSGAIYAALEAVGLLTVIVVMNRRENPMFKLAWIIAILSMPVFGTVLYIYVQNQFGFKMITWRVKVLSLEVKPFLHPKPECQKALREQNERVHGLSQYVMYSCGHPAYQHSNVTYFPIGEDKYKQLLIELKKAKKFIFMEYFIIREGVMLNPILDIL